MKKENVGFLSEFGNWVFVGMWVFRRRVGFSSACGGFVMWGFVMWEFCHVSFLSCGFLSCGGFVMWGFCHGFEKNFGSSNLVIFKFCFLNFLNFFLPKVLSYHARAALEDVDRLMVRKAFR